MRYRYKFEDGKHLVCSRDDAGNWNDDTQEFDSEEEARKAAQEMDAKGESAGMPKPDVSTKPGWEALKAKAEEVADPAKPTKPSARATRGAKPRK